jgi:chemotaxis protein methyltransferase CheR
MKKNMIQKTGKGNTSGAYVLPVLSETDFHNFSELIYSESGIHVTAAKKSMLAARIFKRLKALDIDSYR